LVDNSHFVARGLTRPWEFDHPKKGRRHLWYYDFARDAFDVESSKTLLTRARPWSERVEKFLNHYVETPLSRFLNRYNKNRRAKPDEIELRAIKLCVALQVERSELRGDVEKTALWDESRVNGRIGELDTVFEFVNVSLRQERLFFPDSGVVILPIVGAGVLAVPFHPSYLTAVLPRPSEGLTTQLQQIVRNQDDILTAASTGLEANRRIIIPGSLWGRHTDSEVRELILLQRKTNLRIHDVAADLNQRHFGSSFPSPLEWNNWRRRFQGGSD